MITPQNVEQVGTIQLKLILFFRKHNFSYPRSISLNIKGFPPEDGEKEDIQRSTKISRTVFTNYHTTKSIFIELRLEFIKSKSRTTLRKKVKVGRQYISIRGKDCKYIQYLEIDKLVSNYFSKHVTIRINI